MRNTLRTVFAVFACSARKRLLTLRALLAALCTLAFVETFGAAAVREACVAFDETVPVLGLFTADPVVIAEGVRYLRIEGTFYFAIGCLFLFYGLYRAMGRPGMSVVLTVISLGPRVALAYLLSAVWGEAGIWAAIPIGWFLADAAGYGYYLRHCKALRTPRAQ